MKGKAGDSLACRAWTISTRFAIGTGSRDACGTSVCWLKNWANRFNDRAASDKMMLNRSRPAKFFLRRWTISQDFPVLAEKFPVPPGEFPVSRDQGISCNQLF